MHVAPFISQYFLQALSWNKRLDFIIDYSEVSFFKASASIDKSGSNCFISYDSRSLQAPSFEMLSERL